MIGNTFSVKQLAKLAGVSVKALHLYDKMHLLKPSARTGARYRQYGDKELLRLQQILFYKEMDIPLKAIKQLLDEPGFDTAEALQSHKNALHAKKMRINTLIKTIENTLITLKNKTMINADELYDGLSRDEASAYRQQAIAAYGSEVVEHAESHLKKLSKQEIKALVARQNELAVQLSLLKTENPASDTVQQLVHLHYINTRKLWGTEQAADRQAEAYKGLGQLYLTDERFTMVDGKSDDQFTQFLSLAIAHYADTALI